MWRSIWGNLSGQETCAKGDGMSRHASEPATDLDRLGYHRLRLLSCVTPVGPGAKPFSPNPGEDIFAAYRVYAQQIAEAWQAEDDLDPVSRSLIAALQLLAGKIDAAGDILNALPAAPVTLDHGAGYCLKVPFEALAAVLPLPQELADSEIWVCGSDIERSLCDWLATHRDRLAWDDQAATYRLIG